MLERDMGVVTWTDFKDLCHQRFGPAVGTNHLADLARLPFRATVVEYQETFLARMAHAGYLTPAQQVMLFTGRLSEALKVDVELHSPPDLQRAMSLARAYERRANALGMSRPPRPLGKTTQYIGSSSTTTPLPAIQAAPATSTLPLAGKPFKRLTPAEMTERRKLGLCYNCDEQYVRGHKCPRLFYLEVTDFVDDEPNLLDDVEDTVQEEQPLISLHAITGVRKAETMRVCVTLGSHEFVALLDTGSTHNFVSQATSQKVGLHFAAGTGSTVTVANGDRVPCSGRAEDVAIKIGDECFSITCYSIPLDCYDMVLGITYLRTLGPILWDLDDLCMAFWHHGKRVFWKGIGSTRWDIPPTGGVLSLQLSESEVLEGLLTSFEDVFADPTGLPPSRSCDHRIHLKPQTEPMAVRPYRYPQLQKDELEAQCTAMLAQGIIRPSTSPFSAPVLLVKKYDGSWRFCVDYRALNGVTVKDKFPIPIVEELLDELNGAKFFTKLDLKSGYHQVRMHHADVEKTAFRTHQGHFEFLVMPFGLSNAPSTFQALMNLVLQRFLRKSVLVFFDDILVYSNSFTEHMQHLRSVLTVLRDHDLHVKRSKCSFATTSVNYLGHVISAEGVSMDSAKVQAVASWPRPCSVRGLRGFLGLAGYYRRFINNFGTIAFPLTQLLKKEAFHWTDQAEQAFAALKQALTAAPVLQLPDFSQTFVVDCDASGTGFGAVLHQGNGPIAFFSRQFAQRHMKVAAYERELIGLVQAVRHWRPYLWGRAFSVRTDHYALKFMLDQRLSTIPQHHWISKLFGYDFTVEYRPGRLNVVADALSRRDTESLTAHMLSAPAFSVFEDLKNDIAASPILSALRDDIQAGHRGKPWHIKDGLILHSNRVFVPAESPLRESAIQLAHSAAHEGTQKTLQRLRATFHIEHDRRLVICQRNKTDSLHPAGLL